MKRVVLMIIPALICGMVFTGCGSEEPKNEKTSGELYAMGTKSVISEASTEENPELIFRGSDVKFFNVTTREIVFSNLTAEKILPRFGVYSNVTLYIGEKPLLEAFVTSPISSIGLNDLVFVADLRENKIYLKDGYPEISPVWADREIWQKERDENARKRKAEWDVFIKYLRENGKIVK